MKKINIRAYKVLGRVLPNLYNFPLHILFPDGYTNYQMFTCIECGELFVVDLQNPLNNINYSIHDLEESCPKCKANLASSLRPYPQNVFVSHGVVGGYIPETQIPPDEDSEIIPVIELTPENLRKKS